MKTPHVLDTSATTLLQFCKCLAGMLWHDQTHCSIAQEPLSQAHSHPTQLLACLLVLGLLLSSTASVNQ
jgi:hypothetical protein